MKRTASGPARIRDLNRKAVLAHIRHSGRNSRSNIGKALDLSPAAMTSVVTELLNEGLLKKSDNIENHVQQEKVKSTKRQGRPISFLELNPDAACVYGVLLRPTGNICHIETAWADYTGKIHTSTKPVAVKNLNLQSILSGIETALSQLKETHCKETQTEICGLTIGIPGVVENNNIPIAPKLKCIEGTEFMSEFKDRLPYPVSFENDVNLGALSELNKQPRLRNITFAYLHVYSGVGSSIVLQGNILNGSRGWAGEIGQLAINHIGKKSPSIEQLLSVDGSLADLLESLNLQRDALEELIPYIEEKNTVVLSALEEYAKNLFDAVNVLHSVIDLDEVIIDFPSSALFSKIIPSIQQLINKMPHALLVSTPSLEHQASLHGAALKALIIALDNIEQRKIMINNL